MKTLSTKSMPLAFVVVALVGACASSGGSGAGGAPASPAKSASEASAKPGCEKFNIRTQAQFDDCKNSCRNDKTVREQMCNGDTNCLLANSQSTGQCMEKCEKGRTSAKDASCFGD